MRFEISDFGQAEFASEVTTDHFGAIYTTFHSAAAFDQQASALGVTNFRWPGGTRGEHAIDVNDKDDDGDTGEYLFDPTHDDISLIAGKGLSDMLAQAVAADADLALFLPSFRYFDDLATAANDAGSFVEKLLSGTDGGFGTLPDTITIELGNETLDGSVERAELYGSVANAQLSAIRDALANHDVTTTVEIAIQIGRSAAEDAAIRGAIDPENLALIDTLITHHLPINIRNHNRDAGGDGIDDGDSRFTRSIDYIEDWSDAVASARGVSSVDLNHFVSAWTVGAASFGDIEDIGFQDLGARQGVTTIDTFAQLLGAGADAMSLWGVDARSNPNFFSKLENGETVLSHGGYAFEMMSQSLVGSTLLDGFTQATDMNGDLTAPGWVYGFESEDYYTLFVVANDIEQATALSLNLQDADLSRAVEVTRLSTSNASISDGPDARLNELPEIANSSFMLDDVEFDFLLTQDFEVNRLKIWKEDHLLVPPQVEASEQFQPSDKAILSIVQHDEPELTNLGDDFLL